MFEEPNRRRIYLLRHAEAAYLDDDGNVADDVRKVPLTPTGRIQARKQAAVLASVDFDRAVCSGLPRTLETAKHILAYRDHPALEFEPALEEIRGASGPVAQEDMRAWLELVANPWAGADHPEGQFLGNRAGEFKLV